MDPLPNEFRASSTDSGQDNFPPQQPQSQPQAADQHVPRPAPKEEVSFKWLFPL